MNRVYNIVGVFHDKTHLSAFLRRLGTFKLRLQNELALLLLYTVNNSGGRRYVINNNALTLPLIGIFSFCS